MLSLSNWHDLRCRFFSCRLRVCTCLCYWHHHCILDVRGLSARRGVLLQFFGGVWAVLNKDHSVVGFQPAPQLNINLTLHVHEDQAACESNGHHNKFCPKWPFKDTFEIKCLYLLPLLYIEYQVLSFSKIF